MKIILSSLLFLFASNAFAEYRVFQLRLSRGAGEVREVLSTLDPYQYTTYYPVDPDVSVEYMDSWLCLGDTSGFREYCKKPNRQPAALNYSPETATQAQ